MKIVSLIVFVSASIFLVACGGEDSPAPPATPASAVQEESAAAPVEAVEEEENVRDPPQEECPELPTPPEDDSHKPQGEAASPAGRIHQPRLDRVPPRRIVARV